MQAVFIVLNKIECIEEMLEQLGENKITGATLLESKGMAHQLSEVSDLSFMVSLRMLLDPGHKESRTIFMVAEDDKVPVISKIVNDVTGGLDKPDTGILFTVPVSYAEGLVKNND
jgi:hypothetical protein